MTSKSRWLLFVVSTPLVVLTALGGLLGANTTSAPVDLPQKAFTHMRVFEDVVSLIMSSYVEEADPDRVMEGAMRGLADGMDPMSAYLTADEVALAKANAALPAGDVGLVVSRQFYLRIVGVRDGSPAARAGLRTNDFIRGIDNKPTREVSAFTGMRLLRGAPCALQGRHRGAACGDLRRNSVDLHHRGRRRQFRQQRAAARAGGHHQKTLCAVA